MARQPSVGRRQLGDAPAHRQRPFATVYGGGGRQGAAQQGEYMSATSVVLLPEPGRGERLESAATQRANVEGWERSPTHPNTRVCGQAGGTGRRWRRRRRGRVATRGKHERCASLLAEGSKRDGWIGSPISSDVRIYVWR